MLRSLTEQLSQPGSLSNEQVGLAVAELINENVLAEVKADFLTALARKGETIEEIAAFARELRARSIQPVLDAETRSREIVDVCGTGGDRLNTFNISTTVALIVASGGVTVAKHGNRAITSQAGSADVLEALGVRIDLTPDEAARSLQKHGFAFFFAPNYHPAFRYLGPARKLCAGRGQRTIFNFLGPLLNPARPTAQLVGVPRPQLCEPIARVLQSLGVRRGMVVSGRVEPETDNPMTAGSETGVFLDELSTLGQNTIAEFYQDRGFTTSVLAPGNFPLQPVVLGDLAGSDRTANAEIVIQLLKGRERGPKRDATLLNAGAALFVAGMVKSVSEGWNLAAELIDSGKALAKLESLSRSLKK
ncbi:MAG: anthranilate phosphoribosyltransferase [Verrucomicrobiota bacterium]